ncbi:sugar transporter SWEET1 [Teleopsis dalmanni]|uniref:sugar transporter SWEET1 n=1 Tax=Teleopsis dalmanni TaxID=139649 RepID=UPI0018CE20C7|nr:sugar transporter SWEET1 [Teleopsis dalmanni]
MDALGDILAPHSETIAKIAGTITTLQFLSGIAFLNSIRKKGKSDGFPPEPFIGGTVLTILTLKLGAIMDDIHMIRTNLIGLVLNGVFMFVFYWYASKEFRTDIWKKIGIATVITMGFLAYTNFEDPAKVEFRLSMIITTVLVWLVGSPLLQINKIIEKKSTEGMPFPIIFTGTLVAASWTLYGISIRNTAMSYQNLLLFVLSAIQLSLFAIYPSTPSEVPSKTDAATKQKKPNTPNKKKD